MYLAPQPAQRLLKGTSLKADMILYNELDVRWPDDHAATCKNVEAPAELLLHHARRTAFVT